MLVQREWQDEQDLFEAVVGALDMGIDVTNDDEDEEAEVYAYDEEGPHGEKGQILISYKGRRFSLRLHEIV
jgi:hypothetical protein